MREADEYKGLINKSAGHIPGAVNIDHTTLLDAKGLYKSKSELEKIFTSKGITRDKTVILYCSSGVLTGKGYVALVNVLGYTDVKLYDGGYNEWTGLNNKVNK